MPGGMRHSRAADRRYSGPDSRQPDCPGKQRIYLPDGRGRTRTPLSSRPDSPAHAAQGEEGRERMGACFLGGRPEADLPGAPGAGEGKTTRPVRVPDGRQKYASDGVCGGIRSPFGVLPLFPLARPRRQRAGFTAGGRGIPTLRLRPEADGLPHHVRREPPGGAYIPGVIQQHLRGIERGADANGAEDGPCRRAHVPGRQKRHRMGADPAGKHGGPRLGAGVRDPQGQEIRPGLHCPLHPRFPTTGLFSQWAVASLNALSGSFSAKGLWRDPALLPWGPSLVSVFSPRTGAFSRKPKNTLGSDLPASWVAEQLPDLAAARKIPDLEILLIAQVNPVFQASNQKAWKAWLSRIPLVVQFATLVDDTSPHADLVLPLTTYLEQWDLTLQIPNLPFSQLGLQQPIIPPLSGALPLGDILLRLGGEAGIDLFPGSGAKPDEEDLRLGEGDAVFRGGFPGVSGGFAETGLAGVQLPGVRGLLASAPGKGGLVGSGGIPGPGLEGEKEVPLSDRPPPCGPAEGNLDSPGGGGRGKRGQDSSLVARGEDPQTEWTGFLHPRPLYDTHEHDR